ncbi:putative holin [Comamonas koreensis]|uniref:Holin n=1 Tax=Comamonas koreensis TaxID=160825 RepID=A0AAW4XUG1_9BURK|nr:putative holin [Comamonas koreensis]MCD2164668.1 putative holin [Comamonas koreensis]
MQPQSPADYPKNKLPRLTSWWLFALVLSALVFAISPAQVPVALFKLNLISLAAIAGYWIDRSVFPYARPQLDALRSLDAPPDIEVTEDEAERGVLKTDDGGEVPLQAFIAQACGPADPAPLYFMLGCMIRRAIIIGAAILAVSLGA